MVDREPRWPPRVIAHPRRGVPRPARRIPAGLPTMTDFLQQMAASSRERVVEAKSRVCEAALLEKALATPQPASLRASPERFDLIAELKLRSPAVGQLKSGGEDVAARVTAYAQAGAAAVSVLTEPSRFDGSMAHLETAVRSLTPLHVPAMRKDFLVDPYQVIEARAAGAGGVLVILRMLPRADTKELMACARAMGLFVLVEAFDAADMEGMHDIVGHGGLDRDRAARGIGGERRASGSKSEPGSPSSVPAPPVLAGLNCRDLTTLQIVPKRLVELVHLLPSNVPRVAESGVVSPDDAARIAEVGYEYALVGSALMQGGDPHVLASAMLAAGRAKRPK